MPKNPAPMDVLPAGMQSTSNSYDEIVLRVGEQRFHTTRSTLVDGSTFFAALFSRSWSRPPPGDGSYFLDADSKLFPHILAFLRRRIYPIFYDNTRGFDHALYQELRIEADYLSIEPLATWIRQKSYVDTIRQEINLMTITRKSEALVEESIRSIRAEPGTDLSFHFSSGFRPVYHCPRDLIPHYDKPDGCGRACKVVKAEREAKGWTCMSQESVIRVLVVSKKTILNEVNPTI